VHVVASGRLPAGSSVTVDPGEPLTVKGSGVPVGHSMVKELALAVALSLKVTSMLLELATSVAPSAGLVLVTLGGESEVVNEKLVFEAG
jgi:hypothetical protein